MKYFISKFAVVLFFGFLCASVVTAGDHRNCHFAFGNGVTEQDATQPGSPNIGPIRLRIGPILLDGKVDALTTEGFNVLGFNPATKEVRLTGLTKATWDFGPALGKFHTWEVGTARPVGLPPETSILHGSIRTAPQRDVAPGGPPMVWGELFFAHTDATLTGIGWNRFRVFNQDGDLVNEFTYFVWGQICDVDLRGIRKAQRN